MFRHADPRFPFLWETENEFPGRWTASGDGPVQYLADTPDGAWAEFIRHEELRDPADLQTVRRSIWAVDIGDEEPRTSPDLPIDVLVGGTDTYEPCQSEARRLRAAGARDLIAPSAALLPEAARGWRVDGGLVPGPPRDGNVIVLFGPRPEASGWRVVIAGRPGDDILDKVRHLVGSAERA